MQNRRKFLVTVVAIALFPKEIVDRITSFTARGNRPECEGGTTFTVNGATGPHGGPPLHTHNCDELHIIAVGRVSYLIGKDSFSVAGPFIQRIPAGVPHCFINGESAKVSWRSVFTLKNPAFEFNGANPL